MEKEKSKNVIIVILSLVVLLLVAVIVLFLTGVIKFNGKDNVPENMVNTPSNNAETPSVTITMEEAKNKVKDVITNKKWENYGGIFGCTRYINPGKTGKESVNYLEDDVSGQSYLQSIYKTYDEYISEKREMFTENYMKSLETESAEIYAKEFTSTSGEKIYNFIEKDNKLYCRENPNGSGYHRVKYLEKSEYNITEYNDNVIKASVKVYWLDIEDAEESENVTITLKNENGNWKLDEYKIA